MVSECERGSKQTIRASGVAERPGADGKYGQLEGAGGNNLQQAKIAVALIYSRKGLQTFVGEFPQYR